jgi:hypothetical protein
MDAASSVRVVRRRSVANSKYQKGVRFERDVKRFFERQGFLVVRAAGSHSPVDLVCISAAIILLIQCKVVGKDVRLPSFADDKCFALRNLGCFSPESLKEDSTLAINQFWNIHLRNTDD